MKILITGGGTRAIIDPVRYIANQSSGHLGSQLALAALKAGAQVCYLVAKEAHSPFHFKRNFYGKDPDKADVNDFLQLQDLYQHHRDRYQELRFDDFEDYATRLEFLVKNTKPDVVILAAAVSDYLTVRSSDKIRSDNDLCLQLLKAPKLIQFVKKWHPQTFLTGFKLEVHIEEALLIQTALKSLRANQLDLVVANDLASIEKGEHTLLVIEKDGSFKRFKKHLGAELINSILQRFNHG